MRRYRYRRRSFESQLSSIIIFGVVMFVVIPLFVNSMNKLSTPSVSQYIPLVGNTNSNSVPIYITQIFLNALIPLIPIFMVFLALAGLIFLIKEIIVAFHMHKLSKTGIFDIDAMSGSEFEDRLMVLYSNLGYKTQHTGKTGDFGVDLILEKNGVRIAVQAKCWNETVKEKAVQEVVGSKAVHKCSEAWVVTNNEFTPKAKILAEANGVKLVNRESLIHDLEKARRQGANIFPATEHISKPSVNNTRNVQSDPKLVDYISSQLTAGEKWSDIRTRLIQYSWDEKETDEAYSKINIADVTIKSNKTSSVEQTVSPKEESTLESKQQYENEV